MHINSIYRTFHPLCEKARPTFFFILFLFFSVLYDITILHGRIFFSKAAIYSHVFFQYVAAAV